MKEVFKASDYDITQATEEIKNQLNQWQSDRDNAVVEDALLKQWDEAILMGKFDPCGPIGTMLQNEKRRDADVKKQYEEIGSDRDEQRKWKTQWLKKKSGQAEENDSEENRILAGREQPPRRVQNHREGLE